MTFQDVYKKLDALKQKKLKLESDLNTVAKESEFFCESCKGYHKIKDCEAMQGHWYENPHGCTGGDTWHEGDVYIVCPSTGELNRVLFSSTYKVDWKLRDSYNYSYERQFKHIFLPNFLKVTKTYDKDKRKCYNNTYFDSNPEKFGLYLGER